MCAYTKKEKEKYCDRSPTPNYHQGPAFTQGLEEFLGKGIFASDGAQWRWHRKVGFWFGLVDCFFVLLGLFGVVGITIIIVIIIIIINY